MSVSLNNIRKIRKLRKLSQQQLAELVEAHPITISNLERGQAPLTDDWLTRLSEALRVDPSALLTMERAQRFFVGAEIWANRLEIWPRDENFAVAHSPTLGVLADIPLWAVVRDDSLYPVFREWDIIRLVVILENKPDEMGWAWDRLCVVRLTSQAICVGYLQRGSPAGRVSIDTIGSPPIRDAEPAAIFVVDRAIYRPDFRG